MKWCYSLYLLGLCVLFAACSNQEKSGKGQLVLKDSITVNASEDDMILFDKGLPANNYWENSTGKYLIATNSNAFVTYKFNISEKENDLTRLPDMDFVLKKYEINGYCFYSPDSIIGMSWSIPRVLYLFDINGKIKKTWPFRKDSLSGIPAIFYGGDFECRLQYNNEKKEFFVIANTPYMPYVAPAKYYSYKHFACIGLDKDSAYVKYYFGNWPQMYHDKNYGMSGSNYCMTLFNGLCWLSFCKSDSLYGYKNGELVSIKPMPSPFVHQSNKYFDTTQEGNYDYINYYCYEQSTYGSILTDKTENYLYRIADHENGHYFNTDSTTNLFIKKPWSVIVADKEMNLITEKTFEGGQLNMTIIYPTPKGIWIKGLAEPNKYYYYEVVL